MKKRTNIEIAYELLKKQGAALSFQELWQSIVNEHEYSEAEGNELISKFYTALMMDGRFVNLGDNTWNLREHVVYADLDLPLNEVYSDLDESDEEDDEEVGSGIEYFDEELDEEKKDKDTSDSDEDK